MARRSTPAFRALVIKLVTENQVFSNFLILNIPAL